MLFQLNVQYHQECSASIQLGRNYDEILVLPVLSTTTSRLPCREHDYIILKYRQVESGLVLQV